MGKIIPEEVYEKFALWSKEAEGTWVERCVNVAEAAKRIAEAAGLDKDKAYAMGLLYDIGKINGDTGVRHTIDGYNFLKEEGYDDIARVCITHAFITRDVTNTIGEYDVTNDEYDFLRQYLENIQYNEYDKLVQLADSMSMPDRFVLIETRIIDICLRYGMNENMLESTKEIFKIQAEMENKLGHSVYKLFPEIRDNLGI
ncbi:MAG: HD domain-containing protein [Firmicutes bacterium]|nr:HD domain-containing protein [Bacillota bacterium]